MPQPCRGGGAEDWRARRWGHAERVQVEERVSGRKKAKASEAPGELGVEVSAKGHRIAHSSPPTFCGKSGPSSRLPRREAPGAAFVMVASKEGPKENDVSRKTTGIYLFKRTHFRGPTKYTATLRPEVLLPI